MRRALSLLLVLVFSFPLIAPAFAPHTRDAQLPACCRRAGRHHCALSDAMVGVPSGFASVAEKCPFPPLFRASLMLPHAFVLSAETHFAGQLAGPDASVREAEAGYRIALDRGRHKRGPPSLSLL